MPEQTAEKGQAIRRDLVPDIRTIVTICLLAVTVASPSAKAATQEFDDEAAFLTAADPLNLESFESTPVTNNLNLTSVVTPDILVTIPDSGAALGVFNLPEFFGSHATDGVNYLAFQSNTNERLVLEFADDINAFGINITDWGDFGFGEFTFSNDAGDFFLVDMSPNPNADEQFFGVINDGMVFNRVELNQTISGEAYGIDEIYYGRTAQCFVIDAIDDQFSMINDGTPVCFPVLANDECSDDTPISVVACDPPDREGSCTINGDRVCYTPGVGFVGFEEFTYTAQDAGLDGGDDPPAVDQDTAVIVVDVLEDITPDAADDLATALENQITIIDVLENDSLGNAPNAVAIETEPANGSATVEADDTIRYSPNFGFFGEDSFEYRLIDANGDSDVATVTVCVLFGSGQFPIDIMPSDPGNNLNLRAGQGASISIAILSASGFCGAPNLIDPSTLKFGPGQAGISGGPHVRDVDGDGDEDLLVKFLTNETGIACGDTQASLSGRTFDFQSISGTDTINTFNCPRVRKRH